MTTKALSSVPGSLFLGVLLLLPGRSAAADGDRRGFQNRTFVDAQGEERKYILFVPYQLKTGSRPPLLMFLHGSGERGDNGLDQLMAGIGPALWKRKAKFPFVTVFPQCHTNGKWSVEGPDAKAALAILKQTAAEFQTDPDRVYLTGLSMGGSGSWSIAAKHPEMFAAIVPMCGRGDLAAAKSLAAARLPVWNFCGDQDRETTVKFSRDMHAALRDAGGDSRYTEYPGVGHNCWDKAYGDDELYPWLLDKSRSKNKKARIGGSSGR